jgi:hypothetical protein
VALNAWYLALLLSVASAADENAPYIDRLKQGLPPQEDTGSLIDEVRKKKGVITDNQDGYIRRLKEGLEPRKEEAADGYLESERARLGASKSEGGAIQAVLDGKSKLKSRREGKVTGAAGFRVGASMNHTVTASPDFQLRSYEEIYGASTIPAFELFYEFQPFRSEILGNIGIFTSLGAKVVRGFGKFKTALTKPLAIGGGVFPEESRTQFSFVSIPIAAGLSYRFHLLKYLRPYAVVGFGGVPWAEMRSDAQSGHRGFSRMMNINFGVAILLDWMNEDSAFDMYDSFSIKHSYLSVDYVKRTHLGGNVSFDTSGVLVGMTFEY